MSSDGREIANYVLDWCESRSRRISHLSLQKVVFFCHVWSLVELKRPLVKHQFEAWQHGPVLPYLYRDFREWGEAPIKSRAMSMDPKTGAHAVVEYKFDRETEELLRRVVDFYSQLSASELVNMSHAKGGPWHAVWHHQGEANPGMKIGNDEILTHYSQAIAPYTVQ